MMGTTNHNTDHEYGPASLFSELNAQPLGNAKGTDLPDALPLTIIVQKPELFQPRDMELDERHVQELARVLTSCSHGLDPVMVFQVGGEYVLINGHHRIAAYEEAGWDSPVPVRHFQGTVKEAIAEAGRANSKAVLPMNHTQRQNYAWRLVLLGVHSRSEIAEASATSESSVSRMRRVKQKLGENAFDIRDWWSAKKRAKNITDETDDTWDLEAWIEEEAQACADRMQREFGNKLTRNTEVAARTLEHFFGRKLPEILDCLRNHLPAPDTEDLNTDF